MRFMEEQERFQTPEEKANNCYYLCKCDLEEVAFTLGNELQHDTSIERRRSDDDSAFYNNILDYREYLLAWDGEQPYDTLWFKVNEKLKRTINAYIALKVKKRAISIW